MQSTKIIQFLKCLQKHELREFGKFVRSPFHNNRKDVVRFYDVIRKYHPDFNIDETAKKDIYEKLYPAKKYDSNVIVLLSSYLFNLGRGFLTISELNEGPFFHKYSFLKSLDKHYADNLFEKEFRYAEEFLNNEKLGQEFFLRKSLLEELKINFNLKRNRQDRVCRNTIAYGDYSVYLFIVKLAVMYHDILVDRSAFNFELIDSAAELFVKNFNFEEFIRKLKIEKTEHHDYIIFYYYLIICNYYPENGHYYSKLKEYSFKNFEKLDTVEKSARFHYPIDYCIFQIKSGNSKFLRESFNLYKETLEKKLHQADSQDKDIALMFFRNFVLVGLAAKEYDYIEKFIFEYGGKLKEDIRKDLIEISCAMLYYEKKEYGKALEYLSKVSYTHHAFKLDIKHISVKIYYDTNDYTSFFSLIDTYKHYLKSDKAIPDRTEEFHTNFLNYAGRLAKLKSSGMNGGLDGLKKELMENVNVDFRHKLWLIEKAEELEKSVYENSLKRLVKKPTGI